MNVLVFLIPVSLILGALGLVAFIWTIRSGQMSDPEGDAARILMDDEPPGQPQGDDQPKSTEDTARTVASTI